MTAFPGRHFILVPFSHTKSIREISEQERIELRNYKISIIQYAASQELSVLFVETAFNLDKMPHAKLEVLLAPEENLEQVAIFYTKAFTDLDGDWAVHKKVYNISKKEGGLFKQIPPNFAYVYIEWSEDEGLAHIIEDDERFDRKMIYEVFGTMNEIDDLQARSTPEILPEQMEKFYDSFTSKFSAFDWSKK